MLISTVKRYLDDFSNEELHKLSDLIEFEIWDRVRNDEQEEMDVWENEFGDDELDEDYYTDDSFLQNLRNQKDRDNDTEH